MRRGKVDDDNCDFFWVIFVGSIVWYVRGFLWVVKFGDIWGIEILEVGLRNGCGVRYVDCWDGWLGWMVRSERSG